MIRVVEKQASPTGMHPNVAHAFTDERGNLTSVGWLIYCDRCLGKHHLAPWRTYAERLATHNEFATKHVECR